MSFNAMIQEILGIPGMNRGLAATKINEAFTAIQNESVWSFQLKVGGWLTPGLLGGQGITGQPGTTFLSPGTITVAPYTNTITGDAVATAAWLAALLTPPIITQQQIRVPYYSLYNIIALTYAGTVAYLTISYAGTGQTPGTYIVDGVGGTGSGAQISVVVDSDGTVTQTPIVINQGSGYSVGGVANPPTFTLPAGGTSATFNVILNAVLTIDRQWMEPNQVDASYMVYQAYFPQLPGFKRWYWASDTTNNNAMDWWTKTQIDLAQDDSERTIFDQPYYIVPYGQDTRPGSTTYGQILFELWPHPVTILPYTFGCQCNWPPLVNPNDTVPYPLTEELLKFRTYEVLALWKESQRGDDMERGSGADWKFLTGAYRAEYTNRLKECRNMDRHLVDLYFQKARLTPPYGGEPFSTVNGQLNVGWF
jgi:hypothetical protein